MNGFFVSNRQTSTVGKGDFEPVISMIARIWHYRNFDFFLPDTARREIIFAQLDRHFCYAAHFRPSPG